MSDSNEGAWLYFTSSPDTFWKWSADGQAVEWVNGQTIAFRFELQSLLESLAAEGLPPFENVLMTVAACRNRSEPIIQSLNKTLQFPKYPMRHSLVESLDRLIERLVPLSKLPEDLRTSIDGKRAILALVSENGPLRKKPDLSRTCIEFLKQGFPLEIRETWYHQPKTTSQWMSELRGLHDGLAAVNETSVRLRLATGFETLPNPDPIPLRLPAPPPEPEPKFAPRSIRELLRELEQDEEHAGLVRLAERLLPIVSLPRPVSSPDDQPLGGVSDITNRGPFDRLLLSELAQDADVLMTRVALNEAMYMRREIPPSFPPRERLILVDAGIRMWGLPRVYGTAAALALAVMQDQAAPARMFRSSSDTVAPVDLSVREELIDHLGSLELTAHPGAALPAFIAEADDAPADFVIVTGEDVLDDLGFRQQLQALRIADLYLVTVTRDGDLRLLQRTRQGERVLKQVKFDLNQILAGPPTVRHNLRDDSVDPRLPAICRMQPFPLCLVHQIDWDNCGFVYSPEVLSGRADHLLTVTHDRRLTLWRFNGIGPFQLSERLPPGKLLWHTSDFDRLEPYNNWRLVIGIVEQGLIWLVLVSKVDTKIVPLDLLPKPVNSVCEHAGILYVVQQSEVGIFNRDTGEKLETLAIPPGMVWLSARFFRNLEGFHALSSDGQKAVWQFLRRHDTSVSIAKIFDSAPLGGPVAVTHANCVEMLGSDGHLEFTSRYLQAVTEPITEESIGSREAGRKPYNVAKITADGTRFVLHSQPHRPLEMMGWLVDLSQRTANQKWGNPGMILNSSRLKLPNDKGLRNRLKLVATHHGQLVLMTSKGQCLALRLAVQPERLILQVLPVDTKELTHVADFQRMRSPAGVGYELKVAEWPDGSRGYLDSRGLLHLQSSDEAMPEITLVLHDTNVAGWCNLNLVWGPASFTGPFDSRRPISPAKAYTDWIVPFIRRLK